VAGVLADSVSAIEANITHHAQNTIDTVRVDMLTENKKIFKDNQKAFEESRKSLTENHEQVKKEQSNYLKTIKTHHTEISKKMKDYSVGISLSGWLLVALVIAMMVAVATTNLWNVIIALHWGWWILIIIALVGVTWLIVYCVRNE